MKKHWWQSKTIWVNALVAVLAVAADNVSLLQPLLPANFFAIVAFGLPLVNVFLRVITTQGVTK
jgi:hypothetical protein